MYKFKKSEILISLLLAIIIALQINIFIQDKNKQSWCDFFYEDTIQGLRG